MRGGGTKGVTEGQISKIKKKNAKCNKLQGKLNSSDILKDKTVQEEIRK